MIMMMDDIIVVIGCVKYKKKQISFASIIGLGYNTFLLYPRLITLAKDNCGFIGVIGLTCFIKLVKFFVFNICCFLYHFNCVDVSFYFLVHCTYSSFSIFFMAAVCHLNCYLTLIEALRA